MKTESIRTYMPGAYCVYESRAIFIVCIGNGAIVYSGTDIWWQHKYAQQIGIRTMDLHYVAWYGATHTKLLNMLLAQWRIYAQ